MLKKIKVEDAVGHVLFHDLTGIKASGFKGVLFKRGHVIQKEDIEKLKENTLLKIEEINKLKIGELTIGSTDYQTYFFLSKVLKDFNGVEHRIEYCGTFGGVDYYNDSKGTNPDASIRAVLAMRKPIVLIGGGYDKDSSYDEWIQSFDGKVKKLVLLGATKEKINETAKRLGFTDTILADTFEEAVNICVEQAEPGDAVLLSPACASWGMFKNYEERGDKFKELVNQL